MTNSYVYIVLFFTAFTNCKSQNKTTMEQHIIIPEVTNEFEKFDIEKYENSKKNGEVRILIKDRLSIYMDYSEGYSHVIYSDLSYFSCIKNYFKSGNIEIKGVSFNNGSEYGISYEFDKEGNLIKTINTDEGYDFSWEKVILYCEEHKIPLTKGFKEFSGFQTTIYKKEEDGKKVWQITYQIAADKLLQLVLDGKTGKKIEQKELDFVNN